MMLRVALCFALLATLMSCGWMRGGEGLLIDTKDDYLDVEERPALEIPEDLRSLENTDPFPIPVVAERMNPRYFPERPPLPDAIYANDNRDEVRIQRLKTRSWLVIPESPTTAWPKLKQFLSENGISITLDDPGNGRLNTEWMAITDRQYRDVVRTLLKESRNQAGLAAGEDRYLIKVEQGLRDLTTEVHVRHENNSLGTPAADEIAVLEGLHSALDKAENDLLNEMGAYIAAKVAEQTVSKVAQAIGSVKKAELTRDQQGSPLLSLFLDQERAWATLGQALENAQVDVLELDQNAGSFSVAIPQAILAGEEKDGFFCRVTFSCKDKDVHSVQIRMFTKATKHYDVSVFESDGQTVLDPDLAQQVLVLIREYAT